MKIKFHLNLNLKVLNNKELVYCFSGCVSDFPMSVVQQKLALLLSCLELRQET